MNRKRLTELSTIVLMILLVSVLVMRPVLAFGSKEKTPEEKASETEKSAIKEYNDGVKAMDAGKAAGQKGDSTYAYNYRATSDAKARKQFEKAVTKFEKAVALKPDMAEAYNNLGYCYRKLGKLDESLTAYGTAIKLKKDFDQAYEYRGETYLAMGQLDKAWADLETLKQLKSQYADVLAKSIETYQLEKVSGAQHSSTKW